MHWKRILGLCLPVFAFLGFFFHSITVFAITPINIYEDAEDESIARWIIYDNNPAGASVANVFDQERQSRVIVFSGTGVDNGYRLLNDWGEPWQDYFQVIQWNHKYSGEYVVNIDVETTAGHRYLQYKPIDNNPLGTGEYIVFGLGANTKDGVWRRFVRDLQMDLETAQPGVELLEVNGFLIRGNGRIDDVIMIGSFPAALDSDADGITDFLELYTYGTSPHKADTDWDGINDQNESAYWGAYWNADPDGDGTINLLDPDSDNDGIQDGYEITRGFNPADPDSMPPNVVYEDAEDGLTSRWSIYSGNPAVITNVFDQSRQSKVIAFSGDGTGNGYRLLNNAGRPWQNSFKIIDWSQKYSENYVVNIDVETTAGHRYLQYKPVDTNALGSGEYVNFGLGSNTKDGTWRRFVRDLQADLHLAQPAAQITKVNGFLIRGSGRVDDIQLLQAMPDSTPPAIRLTNPVNNSVISNTRPHFTMEFSDNDSGVDPLSLTILIDGINATAGFGVSPGGATYLATEPLAYGNHAITVSLNDHNGNTRVVNSQFSVQTSTAGDQYVFCLKDNPWVFVSPGDGTCREYLLSTSDLGLADGSTILSLETVTRDNSIFFSAKDLGGIQKSMKNGVYDAFLSNAQLGLDSAERVNALSIGLGNEPLLLTIAGQADVYSSTGAGSKQLFLSNAQLHLPEMNMVDALQRGYDGTLYFHVENQPGVFTYETDSNTLILTEQELGVPGDVLSAFGFLPESILPSIQISNPADGAVLQAATPGITIVFSDNESGIDSTSFHAELDGVDVSTAFTITAEGAAWQVPSDTPLAAGGHSLTARIRDRVMNQAEAVSAFTIAPCRQPTVAITAAPATIVPGATATLTWSATDADTVSIDNGIGQVAASGTLDVAPGVTTSYTMTAAGACGTATGGATVTVQPLPMVTIVVNPPTIEAGESAVLSWSMTDCDQAYIDNGIGLVQSSGSQVIIPDHTTTYTIQASGLLGCVSATATIKVNSIGPAPLPKDSFGEKYGDLIPGDATIEAYDPKRFSVITGRVMNVGGEPLSGVLVTIADAPQYGSVETDPAGKFSLPVEAGYLAIECRKTGYIKVYRRFEVYWNEVYATGDIALPEPDPVNTDVTFNGDPNITTTHQSSVLTTDNIELACTVVLSGDNQAYMTDKNGNDLMELPAVKIHATQFTDRFALPVNLPSSFPFQYAVDLSVEGAEHVRFTKPVVVWVNNVFGFTVGAEIFAYHFNQGSLVWEQEQACKAVKLLDTNGDGVVDALDADSDAQPDDLNGDGSVHDEIAGLSDSGKYRPDQTYVRMEVSHFSIWTFGPMITILPEFVKIPDQVVNEGSLIKFQVTAHYFNYWMNQPLVFAVGNLPDGAEFGLSQNNGPFQFTTSYDFSWAPGCNQAGSYTVRFRTGFIADQNPAQMDVNITVNPVDPKAEISVERKWPDQPATLHWKTENAVSVEIAPGIGQVASEGSLDVSPATTTTYTITATGYGGETATAETTLKMAQIVSFNTDLQTINAGESAVLSWTSLNTDSLRIEPLIGDVPPNGSMEITPLRTTQYTIRGYQNGCNFAAIATTMVEVNIVDTDHDGLPDNWEMQQFEDLEQAGGDDADGDGASNYTEYALQTDPGNRYNSPGNGLSYEYDALGRIQRVVCRWRESGGGPQ